MNDSIKQGWVRFHRKSMDSSVWKNPNVWFVWSWCLLRANHKENSFPFNGIDILIKPGQFITGRKKAHNELPSLSPQQWRTAMAYLKSTSRITIKTTNKYSLVTIVNWLDYQTDNHQTNQPVTNKQPTNNQQITTNKNEKKEENEKNKPVASDKPFSFEEEIQKLKEGTRKDYKIIALYWKKKGWRFENQKQFNSALKRELKPASALTGYTGEQIARTITHCQNNYPEWSIETLVKRINDVIKNG